MAYRSLWKTSVMKCGTALFIFILISSCASQPDYRQLRIDNAKDHYETIKKQVYTGTPPLTLLKAIELALENNLDIRVKDLQKAIAEEQATAAMLGMLPSMDLSGGYSTRDNDPGSTSISIESGEESLEPSRSSEVNESQFQFKLLFSFLDFGLSYYSSIQHKDKGVIVRLQQNRAAQNLTLDVVKAYLKVAAAQYAMKDTEAMIDLSKETETALKGASEKGFFSPLKMLREKIVFLKLKRKLTDYRRNYENSKIHLSALLGYYPVGNIEVDTSFLDKLNETTVPPIEELEQLALEYRPELSELDVKGHIAHVEAKKALLKMFPNVKLFADFTDSSNVYLYNQSWWQVGVKAAFDLLNIPGRYFEYRGDKLEQEKTELQSVALSIGILAEVRIAHANLQEVKRRYEISNQIYLTQKEYQSTTEQHEKDGGSINPLQSRRAKMETADAAIGRTTSLANYYLAYHRLLNAIGKRNFEREQQVSPPEPEPITKSDAEDNLDDVEDDSLLGIHLDETTETAAETVDVELNHPSAPGTESSVGQASVAASFIRLDNE